MPLKIISLFLLFFSAVVKSENVTMVFGQSLAPYIIEKDNTGAELLIIKEALLQEGYTLIPVYTELGKVPLMFDRNKVDAAHRYIQQNNQTDPSIFFADVSIEYLAVFITLKGRNIKIQQPNDLTGHLPLRHHQNHLHQ